MAAGTTSLWLLVFVLLDATDWTVLNGARAQELQQQTKGGLRDNFFEGPSANAGAQDFQQQTKGGLQDNSLKGPSARQSHLKEGLKRRRYGASSLDAGSFKGAGPGRETSIGHGQKAAKGSYSGVAIARRRRRHRAGLKRKYVQSQYARKNMAKARIQHRLKAIRETGLKGRTVLQRDLGSKLASVQESQKRAVPAQQTNMLENSAPNQDFNRKLLVPDVHQGVEPLQQTGFRRNVVSKLESHLKMQQSVPALQRGAERNLVPSQDSESKSLRTQTSFQAARPVQQTGSKRNAFKRGVGTKTTSVLEAQQVAAPAFHRGLESSPVPNQNSKSKSLPISEALQEAEPAQQASLKGPVLKTLGRKTSFLPERQQGAVPPPKRDLEGNSVQSQEPRRKTQPVSNYLQAAKPAPQTGLKTLGRKTAFVPERQQGAVPPLQRGLKGNSVPSQDLRKNQPVSSYLQAAKSAPQTGLKGVVPDQSFGKLPVAPREVYQGAAEALHGGLENNVLPSQDQYVKSPLVPKTLGVKQQTSVKGRTPAKDLHSKYAFVPEQQRATSDLQAARKVKSHHNQVSAKNFVRSNAQQKVQPIQQEGLKGRSAPNQSLSRKSPSLPQAQESVNPDQTPGLKGRTAPNEEARIVEIQEPQQRAGPIQEIELKRNPVLKRVLSKTASATDVHKEPRQAQHLGQFPRQSSNHEANSDLNSAPVKAVQALQAGNSIQQETFFWQGKTAKQAELQQSPVGRHAEALVQEQQAASPPINRNVNELQSSQYKTSHLVPSNLLQRNGNNANPSQAIPAQQTQRHNERLVPLQIGQPILQSPEQVPQQLYIRQAASALHQEHRYPQQQLHQHQAHSRHTSTSALQQEHGYSHHQQPLHQQQVHTKQDLSAPQQQHGY